MIEMESPLPDRLVRIARSIEAGEIYYNASKLAWAMEFSTQVRSSNAARLLRGEELLNELSADTAQLRSIGAPDTVVNAWDAAITTIGTEGFLCLSDVRETLI